MPCSKLMGTMDLQKVRNTALLRNASVPIDLQRFPYEPQQTLECTAMLVPAGIRLSAQANTEGNVMQGHVTKLVVGFFSWVAVLLLVMNWEAIWSFLSSMQYLGDSWASTEDRVWGMAAFGLVVVSLLAMLRVAISIPHDHRQRYPRRRPYPRHGSRWPPHWEDPDW